MLETTSFDLVLMDIQMPEMNGLEATAAIRQKEKGTQKHVLIIAMTAHAMTGDKERCLEAGMDGYGSKPINIKKNFDVIEGHLTTSDETEKYVSNDHDEKDIFNKEEALAKIDGDSELFKEIVELFIENADKLMAEIYQAIASDSTEILERTAHTLKGSVGNFAAISAFDAAFKMEMISREGNLSQAEEAYNTLEKEIECLKQALSKFVKEYS